MEKIGVPLGIEASLRSSDPGDGRMVRILDADGDTITLRLPPRLALRGPGDGDVLAYGHAGFYWELPVEVRAVFGAWCFIARPAVSACRSLQRREFVRIQLNASILGIPVTREGRQSGAPVALTVRDLGAGGCLVDSDVPLGEPGANVQVFLSFADMAPIPTRAEVTRVHRQDVAGGTYGLRFRDLPRPNQQELASFVARTIRRHLVQGEDITRRSGALTA